MISDNYYNTIKKFDVNTNTVEQMKTNICKI